MMLIVRVQVWFCLVFFVSIFVEISKVKTSKPRMTHSPRCLAAQDTDAQLMGYMDEEKERLVTWA